MKKAWRGFRKASDLREREEREKVRAELLDELRRLVETGRHEAEAEYVAVVKQFYRDTFGREISNDELRQRIRQFHDAVNERQQLP
jgi:hypothetical protein